MDSKKKKILIIVAAAVLVIAVIAVAAQNKKSSSTQENQVVENESVSQSESAAASSEEESTTADATKETAASDQSNVKETAASDQSNTEETSDNKDTDNGNTGNTSDHDNTGNDTGNSGGSNTGSGSTNGNTTDNTTGNTADDKLTFPYTDSESGLTVMKISKYSGIFLEDGSDERTGNVAVIILRNDSGEDIEYAEVTIKKGKKTYHFHASAIEKGAMVVVQDVDGKKYKKGTDKSCSISATPGSDFEMSEDSIKVTEEDDDEITVKNLTDEDIPCVRVFYKFYSEDDEAYVGGIAYTAKIEDLKAGASVTISPSHYMSGYSKVVMVRTYDSTDD